MLTSTCSLHAHRSVLLLSTEEFHSNAVPLKLWVSSGAGRTLAQHAVETSLFGFHSQHQLRQALPVKAGLASSKQPHLCMSKLPELNQESLTEKLYHRFIAHSLQNSLVQVSILGNSQEQAVASTICRVCTNKRCWQN